MLNRVILLGYLGKQPESKRRYRKGLPEADTEIVEVSLATSSNNQQGELEIQWHRLIFFSPLTHYVKQVLTKGSQVYVEGTLHHRHWINRLGETQVTTEVHVHKVQWLAGKRLTNLLKPTATTPSAKLTGIEHQQGI